MRRNEREITDKNTIDDIIKNSEIMHLAMCKNNEPYVVPLNFGYEIKDENFIFYFHCASVGKKVDFLSENANVCAQFNCSHTLFANDDPMKCTYKYKSAIAFGKVEFLDTYEQKKHALNCIMLKYTNKAHEFTKQQTDIVTIGKITVEKITAKEN